ncbi:EAL domain-containing protein [Cohnella suwonensis]|uniref:EAL domain-containing protein n=1 Tax=Cohnella suwonensis TaxID=696072 RepID=A0ABW0LS19_9BACL
MNFQTLIDRLLLTIKSLMPDRTYKYFPPDFTLRRPSVSLLDKSLRKKASCDLTLYRLDFSQLRDDIPEEVWESLQDCCRRHLRLAARDAFGDSRIVAVDQADKMDFILLTEREVSLPSATGAADSDRYRIETIRSELEIGLAGHQPEWRHCMKVIVATVAIKPDYRADGAKKALRDGYQSALAVATGILTPQMEHLRQQMEQLLEQGSISVLAQPIMNLTSGDVHGWEILTRGPEGSPLHLPDELFRFASQARMLSRLEFLVVKRALEEISARGIREPVFLNVTASTLSHPLFLSHVLQCLEKQQPLCPQQVYFEITERHQITDMASMIEILRKYRKHGFRFAVDDAGSGYSGLHWIGELVPELIKIDRSVIRHVDREAVKESLLRAIVTAAREINCDIVAEGVEREEEADMLFKLDVSMGQGFYFARPDVLLYEHERGMFQETKAKIQQRRGLVAS